MFKIAICDDDYDVCTWITRVLHGHEDEIEQVFTTRTFCSGTLLYKELLENTENFDLIFLDVELDVQSGLNGIDIGKYIREYYGSFRTEIVYISDKPEYAFNLFQNHPFDFLVKPLNEQDIINTVKSIIGKGINCSESLQFAIRRQRYMVKSRDIIFITSNLRKVRLYTVDGEYEFYGVLTEIAERLSASDFMFIHKAYLVNWLHLKKIVNDTVFLSNETTLKMSRSKKKMVIEKYMVRMKVRNDEHG